MEALSGGVKIDWNAKCQATVENGSSCWGTDACYGINLRYLRDRAKDGCSATVEPTTFSTCTSSDWCSVAVIRYKSCDSNFAPKIGGSHPHVGV